MDTTISNEVKFIRQDTPAFEVPPYQGERYQAMVPDTLDIQERIDLAVNGLTGPTDPEKNHLLYFHVEFRSHPPRMRHSKDDVCQIKHMESLPLMRVASGSDFDHQVDQIWMRSALQMIGPDGLAYWPSLPWAPYPGYPAWCEPLKGGDHYAVPALNGRLIGAMTAYMLRDPGGPWNAEIRKIVDGLMSVAIEKDDIAYFPHLGFLPDQPRLRQAEVPLGIFSSLVGWTIQGLAQYHRVSGYEPAKDLAGKLARYLAYHGKYFGPNGEFLPNNSGNEDLHEKVSHRIHFQHHTVPLLGLLEHALAVDDQDLMNFVQRSFEWARTKGNVLVGYFPENIDNTTELETSETCEVAGMIGLALKMSAAGVGDYWDDADRWIRNQFAENQLLQADWIYHMAEGGLPPTRVNLPPTAVNPVTITTDRVPERNIGGFAGWPTANDWYIGHGWGMMLCCTGNGTRALYYIWEHMLDYQDGTLSVNLLLNRPSRWADVLSHIPYRGQVDIALKQDCRRLRIRIPEWAKPEDVRCTINGKESPIRWDGRYAVLDSVKAGDQVSLTFPISERKVQVDIEKQNYWLTIKGNEVVDIYPRGQFCPLYQRSYYRQGGTRWRNVSRFVSSEDIYW